MAGEPDPFHPSAEGKGLTLIAMALLSISLLALLIPFLLWFDVGQMSSLPTLGIEPERGNLWHMLWGLPVVAGAFLVVALLDPFVGGLASGLKRIPLRRRSFPVVPGLETASLFVSWAPPDDRPSGRRYWMMFASAALFTGNSALLAILLAAMAWRHEVARDLLLLYTAVSAFLTGASLFPGKREGAPTTGDMLMRLSVDGPTARSFDALGRLSLQSSQGRMSEEWDTALVARALELRDGSILHLQCLWIAYVHYAESRDFAHADEILNEALELAQRHNEKARAWVMLECAYAQVLRGDVERARQLVESLDVRRLHKYQVGLYQVALAIRERRHEDYEQALASVKAFPQSPHLAREIRQLEERAEKEFNG